ncbi:MAG: Rossmann-fold NAD(P)-binding domain-containing protein [Gemmatimonadaceae bacterium]
MLGPREAQTLEPRLRDALTDQLWVYRYRHPAHEWTLSIATHAEPGSRKLSLGGFRIAPKALTEEPGFDPDRMAIDLAMGMEEKVYWSRLIHVGGPLALRDTGRIVGGKCVFHPTGDARVGAPRDREALDWAIECFKDAEQRGGFCIVTGQDLGHGTLSDGRTGSLDYLAARFRGCVDADTSQPTAEGNFYVLKGMLKGFDIPLSEATVGLIGVGNIGAHLLERLLEKHAEVLAIEADAQRREGVAALGVEVDAPEAKPWFLQRRMDAVVVNANKESLDAESVALIAENSQVRVVCGSENLAMPDPAGADVLRAARKAYCPTELAGMMGYLTAVEEYLAQVEGVPFDMTTMFAAAKRLEEAGREGVERVVERNWAISFEEAVREVYGGAHVR